MDSFKKSIQINWTTLFITLLSTVAVGCASNGITILKPSGTEEDADKLYIVDCLLPGQIKKLGGMSTFVTPRRPAKLPAIECEGRGGEYVAFEQANSASALKVWLATAQEGNPVAQTYVGEIYEKGMGIEPDYRLAALWYRKAAEQGNARAKLNLGYLYEKGLGVPQDVLIAMALYRSASGLNETDIEFESFIDTETLAHSTLDVRNLKNELASQQQALSKAVQDSQSSSQQLAKEQEELAKQKQIIAKQREQLMQQKQLSQADKAKLALKEKQLAEMEVKLKKREEKNRQLQAEADTYKSGTKLLLDIKPTLSNISVAGPQIHLVDPQLISMRSKSASIHVKPNTKTREIVGRITAPAGLQSLSINNKPEKTDNNGLFKVLLPLDQTRTEVLILAEDKQGKRSQLSFNIIQSKDAKSNTPGFPPPTPIKAENSPKLGHFYAVVIGNNDYTQHPKLKTAVNDAKEISEILSNRYGFKTTTILNANRFTILASLNRMRKKLTDKDNLLVYYAGHGELQNNKESGYWLPVDADQKNQRKWIPNTAISDVINAMQVKRVLVIADSCYSGALTQTSMPQSSNSLSNQARLTWLRAVAKSKARLALTSGGLQPVSDEGNNNHSLFANALIGVLSKNNQILEGQRLFQQLYANVSTAASNRNLVQRPRYAPIRHSGHESGEFFFLPNERG